MKIAVATCVYKRHEVFKIFLKNFKKNQQALKGVIDFSLWIAGDINKELRSFELIKSGDGINWLHHENEPLSNKWNALINTLKTVEFDYLLILGSDDILSSVCFLKYYQLTRSGHDYIGFHDFFLLSPETMKMKYWHGFTRDRRGETTGAGRLIHKSLIENADWRLWDDGLNSGLDASMTKHLKPVNPYGLWCKRDGVAMVDIKTAVNIWTYEKYPGQDVSSQQLLPAYFEREIVDEIVNLNKIYPTLTNGY